LWESAKQAQGGLKAWAKADKDTDAYVRDHPEVYLYRSLSRVMDRLSEMRKARMALLNDREINGEERKRQVREIDQAITALAEEVVGTLEQRRKELAEENGK